MTLVQKEVKAVYIGTHQVWPIWGTLPSSYQEVEYIESSWTQYINTWFKYTQTTWEVKAKFIPNQLWWNYYTYRLAWAYNGSNRSFIMYNAYNPAHIWVWGGDYSSTINVSAGTLYEVDAKILTAWTINYALNWNTHTITYSGSLATNTRDYYLFCNNENWSASTYFIGKVYYFQMYEAWIKVRDFVPCYRKSDNVIWMYDLANDVFYTNSWSGSFTKWPDVN